MKVVHIVSTFSPEHGGPTQEIGNHCEWQAQHGAEVSLYNLSGFAGSSPPRQLSSRVQQRSFRVGWPPTLGYSRELARAIRLGGDPDIYHVHGVWHLAQILACDEARRRQRPYVYHLMGGFTPYELKRKWEKKQIARWLYQDRAIARANCLHVNGVNEAQFLRELGFRNPIAVLPVGVQPPGATRISPSEVPRISGLGQGRRILLYLARIHATKGVELLLEAWGRNAPNFTDWHLIVAGTGEEEYLRKIKDLAARLGLSDRLNFVGMVSEAEKTWFYENAAVYILPSFQENFGNTIAEALAHGMPVVTTTKTPWGELATERCGWICEPSTAGLSNAMAQSLSASGADLDAAGVRGAALVDRKYTLAAVMIQVDQIYQWLTGGAQPEFIWK